MHLDSYRGKLKLKFKYIPIAIGTNTKNKPTRCRRISKCEQARNLTFSYILSGKKKLRLRVAARDYDVNIFR